MAKSKNMQSKAKGTVKSNGIEFPQPMIGANSVTSDLDYSDKERMSTHNNKTRQV